MKDPETKSLEDSLYSRLYFFTHNLCGGLVYSPFIGEPSLQPFYLVPDLDFIIFPKALLDFDVDSI